MLSECRYLFDAEITKDNSIRTLTRALKLFKVSDRVKGHFKCLVAPVFQGVRLLLRWRRSKRVASIANSRLHRSRGPLGPLRRFNLSNLLEPGTAGRSTTISRLAFRRCSSVSRSRTSTGMFLERYCSTADRTFPARCKTATIPETTLKASMMLDCAGAQGGHWDPAA
jgi:hypothetical protein